MKHDIWLEVSSFYQIRSFPTGTRFRLGDRDKNTGREIVWHDDDRLEGDVVDENGGGSISGFFERADPDDWPQVFISVDVEELDHDMDPF